MSNSLKSRLRRARRTRARIAELKAVRLTVHRSNCHIYVQLIDSAGGKVLASASTLEPELRKTLSSGGTVTAAAEVGKRVAQKARDLGIEAVAFDRSGFKYHGRVKALADAAREHGLKF
ncbi:50S ribosomal protein L18 [Nitrosovibrio sp. Nv17]|jgi:large subunit ribosomal protein L18|uniref:50S ribosomal protein L18 n=1 Tax=Nitrosovibrio sp. Nv17 TaxID=1855339 RepID=UPI0009089D09|nr:50S ribosomal protein L18 [Nitrosovibrio sp. Nv17]SFW38659.1 LSU ribosomal protein L18P [Nitrosovibrio sp. Nv17]